MTYHLSHYELQIRTFCCEHCGSFAVASQLFIHDVSEGRPRRFQAPRNAPFFSGLEVQRINSVEWTPRCVECVDRPAEPVPSYLLPPQAEPNLNDLEID